MAEPLLVKAVYKFKGTNNDEVMLTSERWVVNSNILCSAEVQERRHHHGNAEGGWRVVGGDVGRQDRLVPLQLRGGAGQGQQAQSYWRHDGGSPC